MTEGKKRRWDLQDNEIKAEPKELKAEDGTKVEKGTILRADGKGESESVECKDYAKEKEKEHEITAKVQEVKEEINSNHLAKDDPEEKDKKSNAILAAIEAAKRINASFSESSKDQKVESEIGESLSNPQLNPIQSLSNQSSLSPNPQTQPQPQPKVKSILDALGLSLIKPNQDSSPPLTELPFERTIDLGSNRYKNYLLGSLFNNLLVDRLQLGPQESLKLQTIPSELDDGVKLKAMANSEDLVILAEKEIRQVMENGPIQEQLKNQTVQPITEKVFLGFEPLPSLLHQIRGKIIGPQGTFLKHIQSETSTKVQLRGKGSGFVDMSSATPADPGLGLHLWISGMSQERIAKAKELCEDLLKTVRGEFETKNMTLLASISNPMSNHPPSPNYYPYYPSGFAPFPPLMPYPPAMNYSQSQVNMNPMIPVNPMPQHPYYQFHPQSTNFFPSSPQNQPANPFFYPPGHPFPTHPQQEQQLPPNQPQPPSSTLPK